MDEEETMVDVVASVDGGKAMSLPIKRTHSTL